MRKELAIWKEEYEVKAKMLEGRIIMVEKFIVEQKELNRKQEDLEKGQERNLEGWCLERISKIKIINNRGRKLVELVSVIGEKQLTD